jgi:Uma2 family endonuclease
MATTVPAPNTIQLEGEQRMLITDVSWDLYRQFCDEVDSRRYKLSYGTGCLEIMVTGRMHEQFKAFLARLIEMITFELDIPICSGGSMTFQRADLQKGFEPDECWWIAHEREVRNKAELDFTVDPPPDLAMEVEISRSLVGRMGILAAFGIPEVWRFNGRELRFCLLQPDGSYADSPTSQCFPFLRPEHVQPHLTLDSPLDETARIKQFVGWLRSR